MVPAEPRAGPHSERHDTLSPLIRHVLRARGVPPSELDDLTQDCLSRVLAAERRLTVQTSIGYAVVVARNAAVSHTRVAGRRRQHLHQLLDLRAPPDPADEAVRTEEAAALRDAIAALPALDRELLLAHELDGTTTVTLARQYDSTPGGIAARLARARVDYLIAMSRIKPLSVRCRPVLVSLAAADRQAQLRLRASDHLVECNSCGPLAPAAAERTRGDLLILPLLIARRTPVHLAHVAQQHPIASAATAAATAGAVGAVVWFGRPAKPPAPPVAPLASAQAATIDELSVQASTRAPRDVLAPVAGLTLPAHAVTVNALAGSPDSAGADDERFWIGDRAGHRLLAFAHLNQEPTFEIEPGASYQFSATIRPLPADLHVLDVDPSAIAELNDNGYYLEITDPTSFTAASDKP